MMAEERLPRCAVLGSGTMGAQIALSLALGGARVVLWGRRGSSLAEARQRIADAAAFHVEHELDSEAPVKSERRIAYAEAIEDAVEGAGFVLEAVVEDAGVKQSILSAAERASGADTILSSTTSAIGAGTLQSMLARPELFCIAHYAQPAQLIALVEVVPGERTDAATTQRVCELLARTGKTPVICPDIPGFLWARIQHAVLREFATLVGKGLVTPEACDTILKQGYAWRLPAMGAFEHADLAGLDLLNGDAARAVWADLSNVADPAETPVGGLHARGHTGMRSGKGFYDWTVRDAEAFRRERDLEIVRRLKASTGT